MFGEKGKKRGWHPAEPLRMEEGGGERKGGYRGAKELIQQGGCPGGGIEKKVVSPIGKNVSGVGSGETGQLDMDLVLEKLRSKN